jgi:hypothetical protein
MIAPWHKKGDDGWDNLANFEAWFVSQIRDEETKIYFEHELNSKFKTDLFVIFEQAFAKHCNLDIKIEG